ncbi:concanavalin A-like lectin/glucanase, partial [Aureobasidium pullulans]
MGLTRLATFFALAAVSIADTCNPLNARCPPNVGLATSAYEVDFTKQSSIPSEWTISDWATVKFGSKGAEFTVSKRFESPQLWTNFYIHYGKVEIVAQVAPGTGIVSSAVLMSDDADEIDWEWPLEFLAGTAIHRSLELRILLLPLSSLTAVLLYQGTNPALYYLIGCGIYFWAYTEGE